MTIKNPGRNQHPKVLEFIEEKAVAQWSAGQIQKALQLKALEKDAGFSTEDVPSSEATIRSIRNRFAKRYPDKPWSFEHTEGDIYDPVNARHVLDVLAYIFEASEHRIIQVTQQEAEWIVRLRNAYPEMPAEQVWTFTQRYIRALRDDWPITPESQDLLLGHQVWKESAIENSRINLDLKMETAVRWAKQRQQKQKREE